MYRDTEECTVEIYHRKQVTILEIWDSKVWGFGTIKWQRIIALIDLQSFTNLTFTIRFFNQQIGSVTRVGARHNMPCLNVFIA